MGSGIDPYRPLWETSLAARHLGAKPGDVRRWVCGYMRAGEKRPPLIKRSDPDSPYVNFMDFVELLYLRAMRDAGIPLPRIKKVYGMLEEHFGLDTYPLANHKDFYKVGKDLIVVCNDGTTLDAQSQIMFEQIVQEIGDQIKVEDDMPVEWWPLTQKRLVVLRPGYNGSNPSADRVPTRAIHGLYVAEQGDVSAVTSWFDVSEQAVMDAVEYEEGLLALKAA